MNGPMGQSFLKNCQHIRHLTLNAHHGDTEFQEFLFTASTHCAMLKTLTFTQYHMEVFQARNADLFRVLFTRNPGIYKLTTNIVFCLQYVSILSGLRSLRIDASISAQDVGRCLSAFPNLQELILSCSLNRTSQLKGAQLSSSSLSLKELSLFNLKSVSRLLATILKRCPNLQRLELGRVGISFSTTPTFTNGKAAEVLKPNLLPRLATLSISESPTFMVVRILQMLQHQSIIDLHLTNASFKALQAIGDYHGHRLKHFALETSCGSSPEFSRYIIMQCVALKSLKATLPVELQLLTEQPWGCINLEVLELPLVFSRRCRVASPSTTTTTTQSAALVMAASEAGNGLSHSLLLRKKAEWQQVESLFLMRLAALTRLRRLVLTSYKRSLHRPGSDMSWRLVTGLGQLEDLTCLEELYLGRRRYVQGISEFQWMKKHWKSLSKLVVYAIESDRKREWLGVNWPELTVIELSK
ncbi:hypothetical protein DFQ26_006177 [Actinomortierella ambigua]|nr:hypothetical protein DFQ26_006177 [Actinomortierella ambigua]